MRASRCVCGVRKKMKIAVKSCRLELSVIITVCHTREHLSLIVSNFFLLFNRLYTHTRCVKSLRGKFAKRATAYTWGLSELKTFYSYAIYHLPMVTFALSPIFIFHPANTIRRFIQIRIKFFGTESERIVLWIYYVAFAYPLQRMSHTTISILSHFLSLHYTPFTYITLKVFPLKLFFCFKNLNAFLFSEIYK